MKSKKKEEKDFQQVTNEYAHGAIETLREMLDEAEKSGDDSRIQEDPLSVQVRSDCINRAIAMLPSRLNMNCFWELAGLLRVLWAILIPMGSPRPRGLSIRTGVRHGQRPKPPRKRMTPCLSMRVTSGSEIDHDLSAQLPRLSGAGCV